MCSRRLRRRGEFSLRENSLAAPREGGTVALGVFVRPAPMGYGVARLRPREILPARPVAVCSSSGAGSPRGPGARLLPSAARWPGGRCLLALCPCGLAACLGARPGPPWRPPGQRRALVHPAPRPRPPRQARPASGSMGLPVPVGVFRGLRAAIASRPPGGRNPPGAVALGLGALARAAWAAAAPASVVARGHGNPRAEWWRSAPAALTGGVFDEC